jgi:hypothetical protein
MFDPCEISLDSQFKPSFFMVQIVITQCQTNFGRFRMVYFLPEKVVKVQNAAELRDLTVF